MHVPGSKPTSELCDGRRAHNLPWSPPTKEHLLPDTAAGRRRCEVAAGAGSRCRTNKRKELECAEARVRIEPRQGYRDADGPGLYRVQI